MRGTTAKTMLISKRAATGKGGSDANRRKRRVTGNLEDRIALG